jgi:hypothetical protein
LHPDQQKLPDSLPSLPEASFHIVQESVLATQHSDYAQSEIHMAVYPPTKGHHEDWCFRGSAN